MNVGDIMTVDVQTVSPDSQVSEIARTVARTAAPVIPVVASDGQVLGAVSQFDLVAKHARVHVPRYLGILGGIIPLDTHRTGEELRKVLGVTASDLMSTGVPSVTPDTDIDDAASMMVEEKAEALLVLEGNRLAGLLTHLDIIRLLVLEETDDQTAEPG